MSTIDAMHALFLRQSMEDCYSDFDYIRTHRRAVTWDDLVVTASNEAQARAYRLQIQYRLDRGFLPRQTHYHVIPDPEGRRVGSGGATLHVLCELAARQGYDAPFEGRRILVLHSGGDSKRVPQYSACGKLFSRVPRALPDGRASTLFDEFCIALAGVPARMSSGMLVMSGDVLLLFNALQVDLGLQGAACLSIKAPVETGTHHGVFLSDEEGLVRHFLHKLPVEKLEALGAVNAQRAVDIDTGAIWLDTRVMDALYGLVGGKTGVRTADFQRFVNEKVRLNFYGDFLYPMASGATLESYLHEPAENQPSEELHACRLALWETLHQVRLRLIRMSPAKFIHFGSTRELRTLMQEGERSFGFLDWRSEVQSVGVRNGAITAINCEIAPDAQVCTGCYLEDSRVCAGARIGEGCVLSNVDFSGILPADTVLHAVQLMDGRVVARIYGVADNPKAGLDGSWLSTTLTALMRGNALRDAEIFAGTEQTLWTARLYPVGANAAEALQGAFCALHMAEGTATAEECAAWRTAERWSLQESFEKADVQAMITWQTELEDIIRARRFCHAISEGRWIQDAQTLLSPDDAGKRQQALIAKEASCAAFPLQHRLYHALACLSRAEGGEDALVCADQWEDACFQSIHRPIYETVVQEMQTLPILRIARAEAHVALPVRINFGGGWSDTPPYCIEQGGTVLNAALSLRGKLPIVATATRLEKRCIRLISEDLQCTRDYDTVEALSCPSDPHDPHALCKAGLIVSGVIPLGGSGSLRPLLDRLGGGICVHTTVDVPKGSGLGTSSILAAAVARALAQLLGQPDDNQRMVELALCMEQLMSTGGGWQDQVGGLVPGIKLVTSYPGVPQRLQVRPICMPEEALQCLRDRLSLVFTGQRRLARNILRDIVAKVIGADPETLRILSEIQRLASLMAFELERGALDRFNALLRAHWQLSKKLDPGSSNTCIDQLIAVCEDLVDGVMICGAGGGGFLTMIRKPGVSVDTLRGRLEQVFQESGVEVWETELL